MPRKPQPWFRLYAEIINDDKVARLTFGQRWLWITILAAASQSPERGRLLVSRNVPTTVADLARMSDLRPSSVRVAIELMLTMEMLARDETGILSVTNWDHRQFESDNVTRRTEAFRERSRERSTERLFDVPANVPTNGATSFPRTGPETETDTDNVLGSEIGGGTDTTRATDAPPMNCPQHPRGTTAPCPACGRARATFDTWQTDRARADAQARDARIRQAQDAAINADLNRAPINPDAARNARALFEENLAKAKTTPQPQETPA